MKHTILTKGDYVLATKWHDGDPMDHWAVGFFVGMLSKPGGDRYEVADADRNLFRGNGFRRAKKISAERGKWLLDHKRDISLSVRSLWWWVRQKMETKTSITSATRARGFHSTNLMNHRK